MRVCLVDVDSKIPNLALMKIAAYHKAKGDSVKFYDPLFDRPDLVYAAKVFDFSPDYPYFPDCEVIKGGTGYNVKSALPAEIEEFSPDYSIYPNCDYSLQLFSRGCIRNCPFCIVREKEGFIRPIEPMQLNPKGSHIEVLDNNFFANPEWPKAIELIKNWRKPVSLHGVDVRLLNKEQCAALNSIRHSKQIHIAWDNPKEDLEPKLRQVIKWVKPYKLMCYVLIGYWSTPEEDLFRVEVLRRLGIDPFIMPFNKADQYQKDFSRYVNRKAIFKSVKWEDYKKISREAI